MLKTRGNYKNNQNHKVLEGIKWEETKIETNRESVKK